MRRILPRLHLAFWWLSTILTTLFSWALISGRIDPDFGWRLRHGQLILERGVNTVDPFSYSMPSYPFVSHAWSFDLLLAYADTTIGLIWLSLITALLLQLLCASLTWKLRFSVTGGLLNLIVIGSLLSTIGLRAQLLALALVVFTIWLILLSSDRWRLWRWGIPTLAIVWANTHGSFLLLVLLLLVRWAVELYQTKKLQPLNLLLALCPIPLSLLNPYGPYLWLEIWQTLSDTTLSQNIVEWQPIWMVQKVSQVLGILFVLWGTSIAFISWKKYPLHMALMATCALLAVVSMRHLPLAVFAALFVHLQVPLVTPPDLFSRIRKDRVILTLFSGVLALLTLLTAASYVFSVSWQTSKEQTTMPQAAAPWLRENLSTARLYAPYGWGGFLIQNVPNSKVFIDGRMPSWRWQAPPGELDSVMSTYRAIYGGDQSRLKEILTQFSVDAVIIQRRDTDDTTERSAVSLGWVRVYQDATTTVYQPVVHTPE